MRSVRGRKLPANAGFTLVEVMVTLGLVLVVSASMLMASLQSRHSVRTARAYLESGEVVRSYIENIRANGFDAAADDADAGVTLSNNGTTDTAADDITGTVTTDVTDNGNDTATVTVTAAWTMKSLGSDVDRQVSISTLLADI